MDYKFHFTMHPYYFNGGVILQKEELLEYYKAAYEELNLILDLSSDWRH